MMELGTRKMNGRMYGHIDSRFETRTHSADPGMTKRFVGTAGSTTFSGGTINDAGLPGSFLAGDPILVEGDGNGNGRFNVTAVGAGVLTTDPPIANGAGGSTVITIRTP
jgi:hypothetical protein